MADDELARVVWDYMLLKQPLVPCDVILVLCSLDDRVASYAAELFLKGFGKWLVFSGGVAHDNDLLRPGWHGTEAEHFAAIAREAGVPADKILLENRATNTPENIRLSYALLVQHNLVPGSILLVQKPYMERRTLATFEKQWPGTVTTAHVSSPPIAYANYFNAANPRELTINIMIGDLQRIREYPKLGYQSEQPMPDEVWQAGLELIKRGYDKHLLPAEDAEGDGVDDDHPGDY